MNQNYVLFSSELGVFWTGHSFTSEIKNAKVFKKVGDAMQECVDVGALKSFKLFPI